MRRRRCASRAAASGLGEEQLLLELARQLGADVPAQVRPGRWLARGAGERLHPLPEPRRAVWDLGAAGGCGALDGRCICAGGPAWGWRASAAELEERYDCSRGTSSKEPRCRRWMLLANDLQDAARALCPEIDAALAQARAAGADVSLVSGSGPTVLGLFAGPNGPERVRAAAAELLAERRLAGAPAPLATEPVGERFAAVEREARRAHA